MEKVENTIIGKENDVRLPTEEEAKAGEFWKRVLSGKNKVMAGYNYLEAHKQDASEGDKNEGDISDDFLEQDVDINSREFTRMETAEQHAVVKDMKDKSRQTSFGRLKRMVEGTKTAMDFSQMQIDNLMVRNKLMEKYLIVSGHSHRVRTSPDTAKQWNDQHKDDTSRRIGGGKFGNPASAKMGRMMSRAVVGQRGVKYILQKDDEGVQGGGWVLKASEDTDYTSYDMDSKPIKTESGIKAEKDNKSLFLNSGKDTNEKPDANGGTDFFAEVKNDSDQISSNSSSSDVEFEDVPIPEYEQDNENTNIENESNEWKNKNRGTKGIYHLDSDSNSEFNDFDDFEEVFFGDKQVSGNNGDEGGEDEDEDDEEYDGKYQDADFDELPEDDGEQNEYAEFDGFEEINFQDKMQESTNEPRDINTGDSKLGYNVVVGHGETDSENSLEKNIDVHFPKKESLLVMSGGDSTQTKPDNGNGSDNDVGDVNDIGDGNDNDIYIDNTFDNFEEFGEFEQVDLEIKPESTEIERPKKQTESITTSESGEAKEVIEVNEVIEINEVNEANEEDMIHEIPQSIEIHAGIDVNDQPQQSEFDKFEQVEFNALPEGLGFKNGQVKNLVDNEKKVEEGDVDFSSWEEIKLNTVAKSVEANRGQQPTQKQRRGAEKR
ncbi:hypothetical protein AX774_g3462 [Zancudomyces culisetae]|nr:hypothetical protein AX774_g7673 [Zancudomyces culisetae]OMH83040.1 hypothetical protein AX774_g3462 [Zancudomyces culisetae]|eukprot:OMH78919.1 hypothetical protein AX774_g7673 [Zancudomyces culisetae]